jgi:hypothetical protein
MHAILCCPVVILPTSVLRVQWVWGCVHVMAVGVGAVRRRHCAAPHSVCVPARVLVCSATQAFDNGGGAQSPYQCYWPLGIRHGACRRTQPLARMSRSAVTLPAPLAPAPPPNTLRQALRRTKLKFSGRLNLLRSEEWGLTN